MCGDGEGGREGGEAAVRVWGVREGVKKRMREIGNE